MNSDTPDTALLKLAEHHLKTRDFEGCRRDILGSPLYHPTNLTAAQILTLTHVLSNSTPPDFYSVLSLTRFTHNPSLIRARFKTLATLLNPNTNPLSLASEAFSVVLEARAVLSDPRRKGEYDSWVKLSELGYGNGPGEKVDYDGWGKGSETEKQKDRGKKVDCDNWGKGSETEKQKDRGKKPDYDDWVKMGGKGPERKNFCGNWDKGSETEKQKEFGKKVGCEDWGKGSGPDNPKGSGKKVDCDNWGKGSEPEMQKEFGKKVDCDDESGFWTMCPYCYYVYEYSRVYKDCILRCQNEECRKGFTAVEIRVPPPEAVAGSGRYLCLGFSPIGFKGFSTWSPFSRMVEDDGGGEEIGEIGVEKMGIKRKKSVGLCAKKVMGKGVRVQRDQLDGILGCL